MYFLYNSMKKGFDLQQPSLWRIVNEERTVLSTILRITRRLILTKAARTVINKGHRSRMILMDTGTPVIEGARFLISACSQGPLSL